MNLSVSNVSLSSPKRNGNNELKLLRFNLCQFVDRLFQVTDDVEAFVAALKCTKPTVARVSARAADQ